MNRKYIAFVFIFIIIGIVIYFKLSSNNLENNKNWKVYFANLQTSLLNGAVYVPEKPEIELTSLKAYDVLIMKPGDFATYTFDVINDGQVDAKLKSIKKITPKCISLDIDSNKDDENLVCSNLEYSFYYTDTNKEVKIGDILSSTKKQNITVKVGYKGNKNLNSNEGVQVTLYDVILNYIAK